MEGDLAKMPEACQIKRVRGGVAQLGEHLLCKQRVVGSSPSTSTLIVGRVRDFVESRFPSSFTSQSEFFSRRDHRRQVVTHEGFANLLWQNVRKNFAKCGFDSLQGLDSHAKTSAHVRHEAASEKLLEKLLTPLDEGNRRGYLSPLARE